VPFISDENRKKAGLPEQLGFTVVNRVVPAREEHHQVILNIVNELRLLYILNQSIDLFNY
jgi:hypothetical protein